MSVPANTPTEATALDNTLAAGEPMCHVRTTNKAPPPRTAAYLAHVTFKNVEELRQLIDACPSQELSNRGKTKVVLDFECRSANFVRLLILRQLVFCVREHGY